MAAAGLGARIVLNGQAVADDWVHALLLLLSGGMIALLFDRDRQSLRAALELKPAAVEAAASCYRRAFERADMGFASANDTGELLLSNKRLCAMLGYPEGDLVGRRIDTLVHQHDRDLFRKSLAGLSAEEPSFRLEMRLMRKDGSTLWSRLMVSWSAPDNILPHRLFVVVDDITTQRSDHEALVAQKEWLDLALSAGRLGTWRIDYNEQVASGSSQFWEILGLPPAALRPLEALADIVHQADWPKLASPPRKRHFAASYDVEIRIKRPGGQIRWIALRGREESHEDRNQRIGIAADLTSRRQTTLLRAAARRQERMMREERHRFSNLFAVIVAIVKMIKPPDSDIGEFKNMVVERIRALEATHRLLADSADGSSTIRELVLQELRSFLQTGKTSITGPEIKISSGAAESLAMIFHELTTNSIKHGVLGHQGKVDVRWTIVSGGAGDEIVFEWAETGGPPTAPITRHGFGSMVLGTDGTPIVGHSSKLEMGEDGLRYSLRLSPNEIQD
ncbi:PAS domain S-box protein [Mesorhizobium abyssinicae]|uniref:sensor histidine kinase n=1 Tax=Mesorhizobium abyssinicae TaxID=1209958 RepID=UPI002A241177|nr:PAS domain S-box protein [Mesorhizobium abyssinicae]MDX8434813.1 PAS domain S-box protein [Mesorhizobium abyssinicae]